MLALVEEMHAEFDEGEVYAFIVVVVVVACLLAACCYRFCAVRRGDADFRGYQNKCTIHDWHKLIVKIRLTAWMMFFDVVRKLNASQS